MADIGLTVQELPVLVMRCLMAFVYTIYSFFVKIYNTIIPPREKSLKEKHVLIIGGGGLLGRELVLRFSKEDCRVTLVDVNISAVQSTTTLITGAGGLLGRELALRFSKEGCRVTLVDVNPSAVQETAALVSKVSQYSATHVRTARLDVTARQDVAKFAENLLKEGPLDILVNNAGLVKAGGLLDVSDQHIIDIMEVNLMGQFWMVRAFLPSMVERNSGHIVAISSAAALAVGSNIAPYTASKAGVSALMGCLREELRKKNCDVKTTTVHPNFLRGKRHFELKSVLPDITAEMVAASTVRAVRRDTVTLTLPKYLSVLPLLRLLPANSSDLWMDTFAVKVNPLIEDMELSDFWCLVTESQSTTAKVTASR